jgi:hypothetical protein
MLMRPKHPRDRVLTLKVHDLMGSFTSRPVEGMPSDVGIPGAAQSRARYRLQSFKVGVDTLDQDGMINVI